MPRGPSSLLRFPGTIPQGQPQLDLNNSINEACLGRWIFNSACIGVGPVPSVTSLLPPWIIPSTGQRGIAAWLNPQGSGSLGITPPVLTPLGSPLTFIAVIELISVSQPFFLMGAINKTEPGIVFNSGSPTGSLTFNTVIPFVNDYSVTGGSLSAGNVYVVGLTSGPGNLSGWVNGQLVASLTLPGNPTYASHFPPMYFLIGSGFSSTPSVKIYSAGAFGRIFTQSDFLSFVRDCYTGLIFPSDFNPGMFASAGPPPSSPFFVPNFDLRPSLRSDIALRTLASDQTISLIGQDSIYAGSGQVPSYANENPQRRSSPEPLSWWQNLLLSTLGSITAPFAQLDWPVLQRLARRQAHEAGSPTQLIGQDVIYGTSGQVPIYDTNQPLPRRALIELRTWLQNLLQSTLSLVVFPFALFDWPNPRGPRPDSRLQRTHITATPQQLIGQDQIYSGPGQVPSYDLNQPLRPRRTIELWTWVQNTLQSTLTVVVFPFSLLDWPNPLRRKSDSNVLRTYTQDTQRQLIGQDVLYGAPGQVPDYDLTPPRAPRRSIELLTWLVSLVSTTLATLSPFLTLDYFRRHPVPLQRVRDDQSLNLNLIGQDQIYGVPGQVPNYDIRPPQRRKLSHQRGWLQSALTFLTFVGVPFAQTDWPNPRRLVVRAFDWFDKLFDRTTPPPPVLDPTRRFTEVLRRIQYAIVAPRWRYTLIAQEFYGMPFFGALPAVDQNQKQTLTFDFGRFLPPGVTLSGTPSLTLAVANGPDPSPASRITAGPILGTAPQNIGGTGLASCAILVQVATCVPGTQYLASFFASRTDGDVASGSSTFWCNPLTGA